VVLFPRSRRPRQPPRRLIEVLQGNEGQVIHSGLTEARSEHRLLAAPPLRLIVGNAASVRLEYRGQVVDLAPYTRSGVARLTIE